MRRMVMSTLACAVSVKRRNFVPVIVVKHCNRKFSVSMTSSPDDGSGRLGGWPGRAGVGGAFLRGFNLAVIAWTLKNAISISGSLVHSPGVSSAYLPMKCASHDKVVVGGELV